MRLILGVKELVDAGNNAVPKEYLQPGDGRIQEDNVEIPIVNLSNSPEEITYQVRQACEEWGFFQVINHGIPLELMERMSQLVHNFFDMPACERQPYYSMDLTKSFRCGTSFNPSVDSVKLWSDYIYHVCNPPAKEEELPKVLSYVEVSLMYSKAIDILARQILGILSQCLGLNKDALEKIVASPPRHAMRMNYYPPCPSPEAVYGLCGHSDPGGFTILQQDPDVEGLQVLKNEKWVTVKPIPGAFVVNIADQIQILTNGKYKSVEHRAVVNSVKTRVSIASFYSPSAETCVAPLKELMSGEEAPRYKSCTFGEYLESFFVKKLDGKTALDKAADGFT